MNLKHLRYIVEVLQRHGNHMTEPDREAVAGRAAA